MKPHSIVSTICLLAGLAGCSSGRARVDHVPPTPALQNNKVSFFSTQDSLDSPHVLGITANDYEWWWFDAEASDLNTSIVIVFFTNSPAAFQITAGLPITSIIVNAKLPNGTTIQSDAGAVTGATIYSGGEYGNGAKGIWGDIGNFTVSPDLSEATIDIDLFSIPGVPVPIRGSIKYKSIAPPHYPCTKNLKNGNRLQIVPNVGWANAFPAASVEGTFEIPGIESTTSGIPTETFTVNGFGYHDKNWGNTLFESAIKSWFWGHAVFGPWSAVFFNGTDGSGTPFADAYVSKNGKLLVSSCQQGSVSFVPTYDAVGVLQSALVTIPIPGSKDLVFHVATSSLQVDYPNVYSRTLVNATGGQAGGGTYSGPGTVEHFSV